MLRRCVPRLVAVLVAVGLVATACTSAQPPGPRSAPRSGGSPLLGVVTSSAPAEQEADQFGAWLGSPVEIVGDYTDNSSWGAMAASFEIPNLEHWLQAHPKGQVELTVGTLPQDDYVAPRDASQPQEKARVNAMARGATGAFDAHWRSLAETLVRAHLGGAILRLGWEANGDYYPWSAAGAESEYAAYFRRIVTVMRKVQGSHFRFDWTAGPGSISDGRSPQAAYPGKGYVDFIGVDVYDQSYSLYPQKGAISASQHSAVWNHIANDRYGLQWFVRFARSQDKPLLIGEWGLYQQGPNHGGGDDPAFIQSMHDFISQPGNDVYAALYFNEDPHGASAGQSSAVYVPSWGPNTNYLFPLAAAKFRSLFGQAAGG